MGNTQSMKKINYEDMQTVTKNPEIYLIINTLSPSDQKCLIVNTTVAEEEEILINKYLKENKSIRIIVYGKNCNDDSVQKKYQQLLTLGFYNIFVYTGGMFEWLLLQDIYDKELFPTTKKELDLLKYKPNQLLNSIETEEFVLATSNFLACSLFWFLISSLAISNRTLVDGSDKRVAHIFWASAFDDFAKTLPAKVLVSSIPEVEAATKEGVIVF